MKIKEIVSVIKFVKMGVWKSFIPIMPLPTQYFHTYVCSLEYAYMDKFGQVAYNMFLKFIRGLKLLKVQRHCGSNFFTATHPLS